MLKQHILKLLQWSWKMIFFQIPNLKEYMLPWYLMIMQSLSFFYLVEIKSEDNLPPAAPLVPHIW